MSRDWNTHSGTLGTATQLCVQSQTQPNLRLLSQSSHIERLGEVRERQIAERPKIAHIVQQRLFGSLVLHA